MNQTLNAILQKTLSLSQKPVPCDLCGFAGFTPLWDCGQFRYVKCVVCGLVLQNPPPELTEVRKLYDKDYFLYELDNQDNFFHLMKLSLNDIHFDTLTQSFPEKKVLDIGCATGLLLNYLKNKGWDTYGVEVCKESAEYAQKHFQLNIHNKSLEECAFPSNFFEVVHFSHVIEHVPSPSALLKEVYRIMKPESCLIITTPNVAGLFARIFKRKWRACIAQHLFLFSKKTLHRLLEDTGFRVVKQISWGSIPIELFKGKPKILLDSLVKKLNLGDVMLFLASK